VAQALDAFDVLPSGFSLAAFVHERGVNLRYLGAVFSRARSLQAQALVIAELTARAAKVLLRQRLRSALAGRALSESLVQQVLADELNFYVVDKADVSALLHVMHSRFTLLPPVSPSEQRRIEDLVKAVSAVDTLRRLQVPLAFALSDDALKALTAVPRVRSLLFASDVLPLRPRVIAQRWPCNDWALLQPTAAALATAASALLDAAAADKGVHEIAEMQARLKATKTAVQQLVALAAEDSPDRRSLESLLDRLALAELRLRRALVSSQSTRPSIPQPAAQLAPTRPTLTSRPSSKALNASAVMRSSADSEEKKSSAYDFVQVPASKGVPSPSAGLSSSSSSVATSSASSASSQGGYAFAQIKK